MNFRNVDKATWVRIIVLVLTLVNQICISFFNFQFLPYEDEQLYEAVSTALTVGVAIWTSWKNNSLTREAQQADAYLQNLKDRRV